MALAPTPLIIDPSPPDGRMSRTPRRALLLAGCG